MAHLRDLPHSEALCSWVAGVESHLEAIGGSDVVPIPGAWFRVGEIQNLECRVRACKWHSLGELCDLGAEIVPGIHEELVGLEHLSHGMR